MTEGYQAVVVLSFGGPEKHSDVIPFLENVLRGKNVPRERMLEVAGHYYHFDGRSPINDQTRAFIAALERELGSHGPKLPVYWGNRNWHPFLVDALAKMHADGIERAMVFVTSAFSSYSGCRQYLEDIERARAEAGPRAPRLDKLQGFHDHPGFIASVADRIQEAFRRIPEERRAAARLVFTAHSVPVAMAENSPYVQQLQQACSLVAAQFGLSNWELAYQSRSGPPSQAWLEPDINDALARIREQSGEGAAVVISPIGFVSDHMEVLYDLDTEAAQTAGRLGLRIVRAGTPGVHRSFVAAVRDLIAKERIMACAPGCCPPPAARAPRPPRDPS